MAQVMADEVVEVVEVEMGVLAEMAEMVGVFLCMPLKR